MKGCAKVLRIAVKVLLTAVIGVLLLYNGYVLAARYVTGERMPAVFGFSFAVVVTGSMEPQISAGDFIVNKAKEGYEIGDVITFYDAQMGEYVTHRVILAEQGSYVTKGDANNAADSFSVPAEAVVGEVVAVWRGAGSVIGFFQSPLGLFLLVGGGILIWAGMNLISERPERRSEPKGPAKEEGKNEAGNKPVPGPGKEGSARRDRPDRGPDGE